MRILLSFLLLAACGPGSPDAPPASPTPAEPCSEGTCSLFADLDRWTFEGLAADVARGLPEAAETTVLLEDFEEKRRRDLTKGRARIVGDPGQRHLVLRNDGKKRSQWQSRPLPVDAGRRYTLSWRSAMKRVAVGERRPKLAAGLAVEFYRLPPGVKRPARWLEDGENRKTARLKNPAAATWRPPEGSAPWRPGSRTFRPHPAATHVRLVAGSAPARRKKGEAPEVRVDDVVLRSTPAPVWQGLGSLVYQHDGAHPLAWRVVADHPVHGKADELRDAVLAPAPSTLRRSLLVPEHARLELGYGVLPGRKGGEVVFVAVVVDPAGVEHELLRDTWTVARKRPWRDVDLDLSAFAGQQITLALRTEGAPPPEDVYAAVARSPEARAAWSLGRLESTKAPGRLAVFVMIDTLGARHSSGWGGARETTPNLQRIASEGRLYAEARSSAPWTLPSTATYFTGRDPDEHGSGTQLGRDLLNRRPLGPEFVTLAERLQDAGWDTKAWINNTFLTAKTTGLDQGFGSYLDYGTRTAREGSGPGVELALAEIARTGEDRFLFVHLMDPHLPYRPGYEYIERFVTPGYEGRFKNGEERTAFTDMWAGKLRPDPADRKHLKELYEATAAYADHQVGRLYDAARASERDLLFVVTSDHGEEFWEHGSFDHGHSLYDELLHVPLVTYRSGAAVGTVSTPTDVRGVFGTFLDFAGLPLGDAPVLPTEDELRPFYPKPTLYGVRHRGTEQDGWKYIVRQDHTGRPHIRARKFPVHQLFELGSDPLEQEDRITTEPARAATLHRAVVGDAVQAGYPGGFYVFVGPGDEPVELAVTLLGGGGWHPDVTDLPWPKADGSRVPNKPMKVRTETSGDRSTVHLSVTHRPTLILLEPRTSAEQVEVLLNGEPHPTRPERASAEALLAAVDAMAPGVEAGRLVGDRSRAGGDGPSASDVDALKALGYMD